MAKDPAFLFYSNDFLTGCTFLNMEERGQYITLLCAQHQQGRLSEKHMLMICSSLDSDVVKKFQKDEEGLYYNERLEKEVNRRKAYSESRRKNKLKKDNNNISLTYVEHMETVTETINENNILNSSSENFSEKKLIYDPNDFVGADKYFAVYRECCPDLVPLGFERRNQDILRKIALFRAEIEDNLEYFKDVCAEANLVVEIAFNKIDFKSVLNNHIGLFGKKYKQKNTALPRSNEQEDDYAI